MKMNHFFLLGTLLFVPIQPSFSGSNTSYFQECNRYEIKEEYTQGKYDTNGNYVRGRIQSRRTKLPCFPTDYQVSHLPYPHHNYHSNHHTKTHLLLLL